MGVMRCDRVDCTEIMCSRLINTSQGECYICLDCFSELERAKEVWPEQMTRKEMLEHLTEFMKTPPDTHGPSLDRDELFRSLTDT